MVIGLSVMLGISNRSISGNDLTTCRVESGSG